MGRISGFITSLGEEKKRKFLLIAGAAAIMLLLLSSFVPKQRESIETELSAADTARLERELEQRLTEIISRIEGVTAPYVMVTLDSTCERVYAEDSRTETSPEKTDREASPALTGSREPIEKSVIMPRVRGVAVVCGGADNILIREKVVNTAAKVLDIKLSQVYVTG